VPPRKQRTLAAALGATIFEIGGDHDAAITDGDEFGTSVQAALDHIRYQA
jgi:hypothetical protein